MTARCWLAILGVVFLAGSLVMAIVVKDFETAYAMLLIALLCYTRACPGEAE